MAQASWRDAVDTAYCIRSNDTPFLSTVTTSRNGAGRAKPHYGIFNTGDFMKLTLSIKNLSDARMKDLGYKREIRTEALREAATLSARAAKEQGLSAEAAGAIKAKILGLRS